MHSSLYQKKRSLMAVGVATLGVAASLFLSDAAQADKLKNPIAVFAGLDKITGRIIAFEVGVGETVQFGSLQLTPRVCYSRPSYENPQTTSFVDVDEVLQNNEYKKLFGGWFFASSPGLSAIEHPVYDLWLTDCRGGSEKDIIKTAPEAQEEKKAPAPANAPRVQTTVPPKPVQRKVPSQSFFPDSPAPAAAPAPAQRRAPPPSSPNTPAIERVPSPFDIFNRQ